jgi:ABC-type nitrate/sulfonate/bicarbonate transport system permease component
MSPSRGRSLLIGNLATLLLIVALELVARAGVLSDTVMPRVSDVLLELFSLLGSSAFWLAVGQTMLAWAIGLAISIAVAVPLGLVVGALPVVYEWLRTTIEFLRPIPPVALLPLLILVVGADQSLKVALIVIATIWPLLFQMLYGVQDVDRVLQETARSYRMPALFRARHIVLPSTLPYLVTGIRIAATIALIVAVSAELVSGAPGLGTSISLAQSGGASVDTWALVFTTGALGVLINAALRGVERRVLHWHPSQRARVAQ